MADASAARLIETLLPGDGAEAVSLLADQMAVDPPLVLWTACRAGEREEFHPRSVRQVALWLHENALSVLQWDGGDYGESDLWRSGQADGLADLVSACIQAADLAALLAANDGQDAAEEAYLLGLLAMPDRWLSTTGEPEAPLEFLPDWLTQDVNGPVGDRVREALAALSGGDFPEAAEIDRQAAHDRATQSRRDWLRLAPYAAEVLPRLTARLARAEDLENRFQETLQSEKLESLAEFAAGSGHEINNPLAIIGGRAQLLLQDESDPERRRELALMNAQVRRAHEMIADLRLFSRPPRPEPETVDLVQLVDTLIDGMRGHAADRATTIARTGDPGPLQIEVDPAQLNVALSAICRNSLEAIGHEGHVEIQLDGSDRESVRIRVSDDGPGIEPEQRRHLFDPFYSARQAGRGLGFGLSKAWRIITNHGGRIEVEENSGNGAAFTLVLTRGAVS
jgi:signal transduction histidine kinase